MNLIHHYSAVRLDKHGSILFQFKPGVGEANGSQSDGNRYFAAFPIARGGGISPRRYDEVAISKWVTHCIDYDPL